MLVNLSNIFTRGETEKQLNVEFDFSTENVSYDATFEQPVKADLLLKKGNGETFVKLTVQATAKCSCARCLKLFEKEFSFSQVLPVLEKPNFQKLLRKNFSATKNPFCDSICRNIRTKHPSQS